ncbi:hypothetical protein M406DRAFT_96618 [Cryphonectria parasitica EP155]|uniref:PH domain-containing protein n=1 Tax=Cryphonectria parasitica (strain ATCC 38755 / EP155) TaxID=660469 RepID=A0A9P5CSU6_CRYP1|nr:uncharacterized protein M406DRAFT_96618 [Cryphonectria parasitica EP155]KAF3769969.1 hypothetical protein M406DRAFT_96618 [Cryphonectria parasitica EP155]
MNFHSTHPLVNHPDTVDAAVFDELPLLYRMTSNKRSSTHIAPTSIPLPTPNVASRLKNQNPLDSYSPVNQNGSFEFDRVIKSGYLQKRAQKTKIWKTVYLVYRPNTLSIYKDAGENKLRHKIYLSDLTAVTLLKDPKHRRENVFGLFTPSKNHHLQAANAEQAQEWVDLIRRDARIEEEEEEMFLASPIIRRDSFMTPNLAQTDVGSGRIIQDHDRYLSSSPEPVDLNKTGFRRPSYNPRRPSTTMESSGLSGNEMASHSDFSDTDIQRYLGTSIESLAVQSPPLSSSGPRPGVGARNCSQASGLNIEQDPDRILWQGWLWWLRSKGAVRQWKHCWAVLRPRNLILYKDESEYTVQFIVQMGMILNVVDVDPMSRTKAHCLQIITEEKSYRFSARDEESLVKCLGAFKSLLAKRKELEAKMARIFIRHQKHIPH